jgi:hypothetical protein
MSTITCSRTRSSLQWVLLAALIGILAGCGGGGSGSSSSTVTLQSIDVTAKNAQAALGTGAQLTATAVYSDGTHKDVTTQASGTGNVHVADAVDSKVVVVRAP